MNITLQAVIPEIQFQSIVYHETHRSQLRLGFGLGTNFSLTNNGNNDLLETQASIHIKSRDFECVLHYKHALSYSRYSFVYWEGDRLGLALNYNFIPIYSGGHPIF